MLCCKSCFSEEFVKNGKVRGKQRYRCLACHRTFIAGDERVSLFSVLRKALAVIYYRLSDESMSDVSSFFGVSEIMGWRWVEAAEARLDKDPDANVRHGLSGPEVIACLQENKALLGTKKQWAMACGEACPGYEAVLLIRKSGNVRAGKDSRINKSTGKAADHLSIKII